MHPSIGSGFSRLFGAFVLSAALLRGADVPHEPAADDAAAQAAIAEIQQRVTAAYAKLKPQSGVIMLGKELASVTVPESLRYLDAAGTRVVLEELWGNPHGPDTLGMLVPAGVDLLSEASWGVILTYEDSGHVKDDDAGGIDYAKLLREMQDGTHAVNKERKKQGFPEIELVGWAAPPRYDSAAKKLYWAKELRFSGSEGNTLNYNIRVLGRKGVLNLNVVGSMAQLAQIEAGTPEILGAVDFNPGNRYADFDPATDHVAEYGIAALIAGGIAAKTGLLKAFWLGILAFKKFIIIGVIAIGAWIARLVGGRKKHALEESAPPSNS